MPMQVVRGFAVSAGVVIGPVVVLDPRGLRMPARNIARTAISSELARGSIAAWKKPEPPPARTPPKPAPASGPSTPIFWRLTAA